MYFKCNYRAILNFFQGVKRTKSDLLLKFKKTSKKLFNKKDKHSTDHVNTVQKKIVPTSSDMKFNINSSRSHTVINFKEADPSELVNIRDNFNVVYGETSKKIEILNEKMYANIQNICKNGENLEELEKKAENLTL